MPSFTILKPPTEGAANTRKNGRLVVPDNPIIPFIEGDGTGPDIWRASQHVFDSAVQKAYGGTRRTCEMDIDPTTETSFDPQDPRFASTCQADALNKDWYYGDPTHPETNTGMMGFYESGGFGYFFDFFKPL